MSRLKEYLKLCKAEYYAGNPIISDSQYDALEEICNEDLSVGTNKGRTKHWFRMYSLKKYYRGEALPSDTIYFVTPKLDGAAVAIRYLNGLFDSVVTRGNGEYGEDVTHLFTPEKMAMMNIPFDIPNNQPVQINGEVCSPATIPNARNYASGALGLKDVGEFHDKDVTFFAYDHLEFVMESYLGTLCYLEDLGFKTVRSRSTFSYPKDGEVYRMDCNTKYVEVGFTSKHPRGAFALKERSDGVQTIIRDVVWQTGKSGKVTPVALLEPTIIDGATVSRATLNNVGFIEALGVEIGDSVMVERAGGIIPRIIRKAE